MKNGTTKLRDVSEHITVGFVGSMSKYFIDDGVPLLRGQNIKPYQLDLTNLKYIPPEIHKKWKKSSLRADDVVIVRVGYPGTACVIPEGFGDLNAASLVIVRPNPDKLDSRYLCYVINSPWGKATIQGRLVGAAQQVFNTNTAAELEIHLPPLPTQRKITAILSAYDDLIENNTRRIKILEEMAQALYREWFVKFRFPGHEKVKMVESELGMVPEGWEVRRLGDIARETRRSVHPEKINPKTPYIGLQHIPRKSIALSEWGMAGEVKSTKLSFRSGEILFGKIRPYFHKVSVAPLDGVCSSDTIVISPKDSDYFSIVLACVSSEEFVNHATQTSQGTKMPRANWKILIKYPVVIPPLPLLIRFDEFMQNVINQIQNMIFRNRNLCRTRNLLLPKLISGEVYVDNIDVQMPNNGGA